MTGLQDFYRWKKEIELAVQRAYQRNYNYLIKAEDYPGDKVGITVKTLRVKVWAEKLTKELIEETGVRHWVEEQLR